MIETVKFLPKMSKRYKVAAVVDKSAGKSGDKTLCRRIKRRQLKNFLKL